MYPTERSSPRRTDRDGRNNRTEKLIHRFSDIFSPYSTPLRLSLELKRNSVARLLYEYESELQKWTPWHEVDRFLRRHLFACSTYFFHQAAKNQDDTMLTLLSAHEWALPDLDLKAGNRERTPLHVTFRYNVFIGSPLANPLLQHGHLINVQCFARTGCRSIRQGCGQEHPANARLHEQPVQHPHCVSGQGCH